MPALAALLLLAAAPAPSDDQADWIAANAVTIRSIDPKDADFADLAPLAAKIGGARIVQLGEATHGDGATLTAKARLVKFMHEAMGFDVIAWESGLYDVRLAEAALHRADSSPGAAAACGIFDIWANAAQCAPLFEYARSTHGTARPLVMAGLDPQYGGGESGAAYARDLADLFGDVLPAEQREFATGIRGALEKSIEGTPEERAAFALKTAALLAALDRERARLAARRSESEIAFLRNTIEGLVAVSKMMEGMKAGAGPKAMNPRAEAMARNVAFLAEEYFRGKKIIVWANTFHTLRDPAGIEVPGKPGRLAEVRPMGQLLAEKFGAGVYTIAFVSARGKTQQLGAPTASDIAEASAESFEGICRKTGKPYLFVDLRSLGADHWLSQPSLARAIGHQEMRADWGKHLDAFFYIEEGVPVVGT